ncbi:hypothetical protein N9E48_09565 [Paracoccaceae bacterium]|nr:hypothetical protein [Paracoccaceae bacterium]
MPLKMGVKEPLIRLWEGGTPTIIATHSRTENPIYLLKIAGIQRLISFLFGGDQATHSKAGLEIYLKVATESGICLQDCAFFEDRVSRKFSAVRPGSTKVQVPDLKQPADSIRSFGHVIAEIFLYSVKKTGLI